MVAARRGLQFSLRGLLSLLTVFAVWLGVVVNRAREQRETARAIQELGGFVLYDWHFDEPSPAEHPHGPAWLQRVAGDDLFQDIDTAAFPDGRYHPTESELLSFVPRLRRLRGLKTLILWPSMPEDTKQTFKAALPRCRIRFLGLYESRPSIYREGYEPPPGPGMLSKVIDIVKMYRRKNPISIGP